MARGELLQARLRARVEQSPHRLIVVWAPAAPVVTSTPTNPFGPQPTPSVIQTPPTPARPAVTLRCLWADGVAQGDLERAAERAMRREVGWYTEATAVARVLVSEAAIDPANPWAGTIFDTAHHVEFRNQRFDVVQWTPVSAGDLTPITYAIWVRGAQQQ
jgi:hypothetical protein